MARSDSLAEKFARLKAKVAEQFAEGRRLEGEIVPQQEAIR